MSAQRRLSAELDLLRRAQDWCASPDDAATRQALGHVLQTRRHELTKPLYQQLARGADNALAAKWGEVPVAIEALGELIDAVLADEKAAEEAKPPRAWQARADLA